MKIEPPKTCPSCGGVVEFKKDVLYCLNIDCTAKTNKAIEHWAKTLKIKGLGPKTIEKLGISSPVELYQLTTSYVQEALGSEKLAEKLISEIEKSKLAKLNQVLPAFGIPLIGNSATEKLSHAISHLYDLSFEKAREAGLGPKATENLMEWFNKSDEIIEVLPFDFEFDYKPQVKKEARGIVCISGKLKSFKTKAIAQKVLEEAGFKVKSSVTKEVTHLINESGVESDKTKKALANGVQIVTNINTLLGD
jgi:NAD-dependent DNA ligase